MLVMVGTRSGSLARMTIRNDTMQDRCALRLAVLLCVWLVVSVGGVQGEGADSDPFEAAQLERFSQTFPLPEVSLPDLEGKDVSLESFKGQVVLINFWTTW